MEKYKHTYLKLTPNKIATEDWMSRIYTFNILPGGRYQVLFSNRYTNSKKDNRWVVIEFIPNLKLHCENELRQAQENALTDARNHFAKLGSDHKLIDLEKLIDEI